MRAGGGAGCQEDWNCAARSRVVWRRGPGAPALAPARRRGPSARALLRRCAARRAGRAPTGSQPPLPRACGSAPRVWLHAIWPWRCAPGVAAAQSGAAQAGLLRSAAWRAEPARPRAPHGRGCVRPRHTRRPSRPSAWSASSTRTPAAASAAAAAASPAASRRASGSSACGRGVATEGSEELSGPSTGTDPIPGRGELQRCGLRLLSTRPRCRPPAAAPAAPSFSRPVPPHRPERLQRVALGHGEQHHGVHQLGEVRPRVPPGVGLHFWGPGRQGEQGGEKGRGQLGSGAGARPAAAARDPPGVPWPAPLGPRPLAARTWNSLSRAATSTASCAAPARLNSISAATPLYTSLGEGRGRGGWRMHLWGPGLRVGQGSAIGRAGHGCGCWSRPRGLLDSVAACEQAPCRRPRRAAPVDGGRDGAQAVAEAVAVELLRQCREGALGLADEGGQGE
jgi:hypothetical protein